MRWRNDDSFFFQVCGVGGHGSGALAADLSVMRAISHITDQGLILIVDGTDYGDVR
ncbi:MAG: hypothetical protein M2R45_05378 [Verrucomicrobia subdivision 3 bacterium]|nr:hypothetical protein [Limisphaerales bacterium]